MNTDSRGLRLTIKTPDARVDVFSTQESDVYLGSLASAPHQKGGEEHLRIAGLHAWGRIDYYYAHLSPRALRLSLAAKGAIPAR